jgi:hypothetical protein
MLKNAFLFLTGMSGSGKGWFWENILKPTGKFHKLVSCTSRRPREDEADGREYYFKDEKFFDDGRFATKLFVNEAFWEPGDPKWLYGVTEAEVRGHIGENLVYDVIEPKYVRQMIDWFVGQYGRLYDFKIAYFLSYGQGMDVADKRKNMPNDMKVRAANRCDPVDFLHAGLHPDWFMLSGPDETAFDPRAINFIRKTR